MVISRETLRAKIDKLRVVYNETHPSIPLAMPIYPTFPKAITSEFQFDYAKVNSDNSLETVGNKSLYNTVTEWYSLLSYQKFKLENLRTLDSDILTAIIDAVRQSLTNLKDNECPPDYKKAIIFLKTLSKKSNELAQLEIDLLELERKVIENRKLLLISTKLKPILNEYVDTQIAKESRKRKK